MHGKREFETEIETFKYAKMHNATSSTLNKNVQNLY